MEDPVCAFGKVSKLSCELLGLFHRELLAMGMPDGMDQQTNALDIIIGHTHSLRVGWRNFFPVVLSCQFLVLAGNRFWFTHLCT